MTNNKSIKLTVNGAVGFFPKEFIENAVGKQIKKKINNYAVDNVGYAKIYDAECPNCGIAHKEYYPYQYCNHCGQALDWSGVE